MYNVVEFAEESGGGIAIIHNKWFTPKKQEVFWPPYKEVHQFNRALIKGEDVNKEVWNVYSIKKNFCGTDDFEKAKRKLKLAEEISDVNTETEETLSSRRIIKKPRRIFNDSSSDEECSRFERPPKIAKSVLNQLPEKTTFETPNRRNNSDNRRVNSNTPSSSQIVDTQLSEDSALQKKILENLLVLREQNEQILYLLKKIKKDNGQQHVTTCMPDIRVALPLENLNAVTDLEKYLSNEENCSALSSYLASLGGKTVATRTNRILRQLLTDKVASSYNFYGSRNRKQPFINLQLTKIIICSVKISNLEATDKEIEDAIKVWLKHAPDRLKRKGAQENENAFS